MLRGGGSWESYCFHINAHLLCVTNDIRYCRSRYYPINIGGFHRYTPLII
nr:MAG TPA: hypothetical protein [Caudoviricetes sp.]